MNVPDQAMSPAEALELLRAVGEVWLSHDGMKIRLRPRRRGPDVDHALEVLRARKPEALARISHTE